MIDPALLLMFLGLGTFLWLPLQLFTLLIFRRRWRVASLLCLALAVPVLLAAAFNQDGNLGPLAMMLGLAPLTLMLAALLLLRLAAHIFVEARKRSHTVV